MGAPLQDRDGHAGDLTLDHLPGVALNRRLRKARELGVADDLRVLHGIGDGAEPRAQDHADVRPKPRSHCSSAPDSKASGNSSPIVVVCGSEPGRPRKDGGLRIRELRQPLAATAAGRAVLDPLGDDRDGRDPRLAGCDHGADRRGFGALRLGVGGVLNVRADVDRAARAAQRSPDPEVRVRRVGAAHDGVRGRE